MAHFIVEALRFKPCSLSFDTICLALDVDQSMF